MTAALDCSMFDPVTIDWIGRVNANSGTVDRTTRKAVDKFVQSLKLNSIWTKCKRINLFAGDQLAAAQVPLLVGGGNAIETNHNFVSGDYTLAGGLVGNTSNKYFQTGWIPSSELVTSLDAHHGTICLAGSAAGATRGIFGGTDTTNIFLHWWITSPFQQTKLGNAANGSAAYSQTPPDTGHIVRSNTAASTGGVYRDAVSKSAVVSTTNALCTVECYVGAYNNNGSPASYSGYTYGGYHVGLGLTATDVTNMYNAINTFCTAIGRTLP